MYKALVSFSGNISMSKGQIKEIKDKELIKDLIKANYIEEVPQEKEIKKNKKSV